MGPGGAGLSVRPAFPGEVEIAWALRRADGRIHADAPRFRIDQQHVHALLPAELRPKHEPVGARILGEPVRSEVLGEGQTGGLAGL